jgi:lipopolysaccharide biosynthesis protein
MNLIYKIVLKVFYIVRIQLFFSKQPHILLRQGGNKKPYQLDNLCVFASYAGTNQVAPYVLNYLSQVQNAGYEIIFVTTSTQLESGEINALAKLCVAIIQRKNRGLDFGSWKAGLLYSGVEWQKYKKILFANDSCYAPLYPMEKLLQQEGHGVLSITDSLEQEPHLMSYFLLCHQDVINHPDFLKFWQNVRMVPTRLKGLIVQLYEIGLSRYFRKRGFRLKAAYPVTEIGCELGLTEAELETTNPTHRFWRYLIEAKKCPILKVDLFKRCFKGNNDNSWRQVVSAANYDIRLILEHQGLKE